MRFAAHIASAIAVTACLTSPALGQGTDVLVPAEPLTVIPAPSTKLAFTVAAGGGVSPGYFGSDELVASPTGALGILYLQYNGKEYGTADPWAIETGLDFGASLRFVGERSAALYPELAGMTDIDPALELGGTVSFAQPAWEVFADLRYGIGGHESAVGELGMNLIARPNDALTLTAGPRVFIGSDDYAATYFGVTAAEAAASGFNAYDAQGGVLSAGVALGASYNLGSNWGLAGRVNWDRLQGDAAGSPIVQQGTEDQFSATIVATRRFSFEF